MYNRRSKLDPLWNALVFGGVDPKTKEPVLGYVDLLGTTYQSATIATGFGLHLSQPMPVSYTHLTLPTICSV